ncbi:MAG: hypothetical protein J6V38_02485 [Kiritimatiellae bacterium]|nr:hypothetical protein [Kiritimatiellia bacterium]
MAVNNIYQNNYAKQAYKSYTLRLRYDKDADLIEYLDSRGDSPQNVIKDMIVRSYRANRKKKAVKADENRRDQRDVEEGNP